MILVAIHEELNQGTYLLLIIPILTTSIVTIITAIKAQQIKSETVAVKQELKTFNEMTVGQSIEANEARRIAEIPLEERTPKEKRHMGMTDTITTDNTQSISNEES